MSGKNGPRPTDEQLKIIEHVVGNKVTVVSAGAGTGKTFTMVGTVLELIDRDPENVRVDEFILITFTNKAADEMRERLEQVIDKRLEEAYSINDGKAIRYWNSQKERLSNVFIGTIHRFCSMLLRTFGYEERVPHETEVLIQRSNFMDAMNETMNECLQDSDTSILFTEPGWAPYELSGFIEEVYENIRVIGRSVDDVVNETLSQPEDRGKRYRVAVVKMVGKLHQHYKEIKVKQGGVDTNDLLNLTKSMLSKSSMTVGPLLGSRYKYLFVDEFQDTDRIQKEIVNYLIPYLTKALMVGDRKQSIYKFRGADQSILGEMAEEHHVSVLPLTISRRPTKPLLEAQNKLFEDMKSRYPVLEDHLRPAPDSRVPRDHIVPFEFHLVSRASLGKRIEETMNCVSEILNLEIDDKDEGLRKVKYSDICLLFRSNRQMEEYAERFRLTDIQFVMDTGGGFFRKHEIVGCYYMLQAILRYPDDVSLYLALKTDFITVKPPYLSAYKSSGNNYPLCGWLESDSRVRNWFDSMQDLRRRSKVELVPQMLIRLYEFTKIREIYAKKGDNQAVANLEKLILWSRELMNAEALTLQQFVNRLQIAILTNEILEEADTGEETKPDAVVFSTVHSSKGLEYPIVCIPELQKPIVDESNLPMYFDVAGWGIDVCLPGKLGMSPKYNEFLDEYKKALYDEEARVFYVALTRAQHAVRLISGGININTMPFTEYWSWKDEILHAKGKLKALGSGKASLIF